MRIALLVFVMLLMSSCSSNTKNGVIPDGQLFVLLEQLLINNITKTSNAILIRMASVLNLYVVLLHLHIVDMV
jgi:uncharacterized protein YcfL